MTKSEMIDAIAARAELTKARAEMVVNCVFDTMTEALQRGEGIEIRGFGSFTVRPYKPYDGRNPRTGQPVPVPWRKRLPFFKVGKELKELVNGSRHIAMVEDEDDEGRRVAGSATRNPLVPRRRLGVCVGLDSRELRAAPAVAPPPRDERPVASRWSAHPTSFPQRGLRWMAVARLAELAHTPSLAAPLSTLFPASRLDAFARSSGVPICERHRGAWRRDSTTRRSSWPKRPLTTRRWRLASSNATSTVRAPTRRGQGFISFEGAVGVTPETLVRLESRFVAVSVGDPTPARIVERCSLSANICRSLPALKGAALSHLPAELESAPAFSFYAPGPFDGEWASWRAWSSRKRACCRCRRLAFADRRCSPASKPFSSARGSVRTRRACRLPGAISPRKLRGSTPRIPDQTGVAAGGFWSLRDSSRSPSRSLRYHSRAACGAAIAADVWEILASPNRPANAPRGAPGAGDTGETHDPDESQIDVICRHFAAHGQDLLIAPPPVL